MAQRVGADALGEAGEPPQPVEPAAEAADAERRAEVVEEHGGRRVRRAASGAPRARAGPRRGTPSSASRAGRPSSPIRSLRPLPSTRSSPAPQVEVAELGRGELADPEPGGVRGLDEGAVAERDRVRGLGVGRRPRARAPPSAPSARPRRRGPRRRPRSGARPGRPRGPAAGGAAGAGVAIAPHGSPGREAGPGGVAVERAQRGEPLGDGRPRASRRRAPRGSRAGPSGRAPASRRRGPRASRGRRRRSPRTSAGCGATCRGPRASAGTGGAPRRRSRRQPRPLCGAVAPVTRACVGRVTPASAASRLRIARCPAPGSPVGRRRPVRARRHAGRRPAPVARAPPGPAGRPAAAGRRGRPRAARPSRRRSGTGRPSGRRATAPLPSSCASWIGARRLEVRREVALRVVGAPPEDVAGLAGRDARRGGRRRSWGR